MNTTYLFKEETTNGQKKLRIGTAQEFAKVAEQNRALPIEKRRYFIKEKSLDPDSPDYLFIEVSREEYIQWNRENNARCKNDGKELYNAVYGIRFEFCKSWESGRVSTLWT